MNAWRRFVPSLEDVLLLPGVCALTAGVTMQFGVSWGLIEAGVLLTLGGLVIGRGGA